MRIVKEYCRHYRYPTYHDVDRNGTRKVLMSKSLHRYYKSGVNKSHWEPSSRGGLTEYCIQVEHEGNVVEIVGSAECSIKDNFCYKTGKTLAMCRAISFLMAVFNNQYAFDPESKTGDLKVVK